MNREPSPQSDPRIQEIRRLIATIKNDELAPQDLPATTSDGLEAIIEDLQALAKSLTTPVPETEEKSGLNNETIDIVFSQSQDGYFLMMLDEPVAWHDTANKEQLLDVVFTRLRITKINDALLNHYGAKPEQLLGLTPADFFAHNISYGKAVWCQILDQGQLKLQTEARQMDGTPIWIESEYVCLYDELGHTRGLFAIQRDVTQRKQAEETFRLTRFTIEKVADAIYWIDENARILDVNETACQMLGYTRAELVQMTVLDVGQVDQADWNEHWQELTKTQKITIETKHRTKDGQDIPVELIANYIEYGDKAINCAVVRDITERKRIEAMLQKSEDRLQQAIRASQIGIYDHDQITDTIYWSPEQRKNYGWDLEETPTLSKFLEQVYPEDRERIGEAVKRAHDPTGDGLFDVEHRIVRRDGAIRWLSTRSQTYFAGVGSARHPVRTVGAVLDITDSKEAEEALKIKENAIASAINGIVIADAQGFITYANAAFLKMWGYENEQKVLGKSVQEFWAYPRGERSQASEAMLSEGSWMGEVSAQKQDGSRFDAQLSASLVKDEGGSPIYLMGSFIDITKRKQAEATAVHFGRILDASLNEIYIFDADSLHFVQVNHGAQKNLGYTMEELQNLTPVDLKPEYTFETFKKQIEPLRRGAQEQIQFETYHQRKNGSLYPVEVHLQLSTMDENLVYIAIILNITDRIKAEKSLRENESRLRQAELLARTGHYAYDADFGNFVISDGFKEIWGFERDANPDLNELMSRIHPEDQWALAESTRAAEEMRGFNLEYRIVHPDGSEVFVHSTAEITPNEEGRPPRFFGTLMDITGQKQTEMALRESEARLEEAQRIAHLGSWEWIAETDTPTWSRELCAILEVDPDQPVPTVAEQNQLYTPDTMERMHRAIEAAMQMGKPYEIEMERVRKDGSRKWLLARGEPWHDHNGQLIGLRGTALDITKQKQTEMALKAYTMELERSNRELQDYAYISSHDLQEPLRKIQVISNRLQSSYQDKLDAKGNDYLARIQNSAARMQALIQDLLSFSQVANKMPAFTAVSLNDIARQTVTDLELLIEETRAQIHIADLPSIEADATQMKQLFQNLISNALKFRKENIQPVISITSQQITDETENVPRCRLTFTDNGIGFDEKYLDRIFTVFQRLHKQHNYQGTGIGLAVCRKVVEHHGGQITARSQPGEGSTFVVTLPIHQHNHVQKLNLNAE